MPTYVVLWADNPGLHPGDDFAPLQVQGHPGLMFWYQEYSPEASAQRDAGTVPDYWVRFAGIQPDGSWEAWHQGGNLVDAANPEALRAMVTEMQWK